VRAACATSGTCAVPPVALSIALRSASSLVDRRGLIVTTEIGAIDDELRGRAA